MNLEKAKGRLLKEKVKLIEAMECSLSGISERNDWGGLVQAIDTVLKELGRLSQENEELKQKINDFVEEMRCME